MYSTFLRLPIIHQFTDVKKIAWKCMSMKPIERLISSLKTKQNKTKKYWTGFKIHHHQTEQGQHHLMSKWELWSTPCNVPCSSFSLSIIATFCNWVSWPLLAFKVVQYSLQRHVGPCSHKQAGQGGFLEWPELWGCWGRGEEAMGRDIGSGDGRDQVGGWAGGRQHDAKCSQECQGVGWIGDPRVNAWWKAMAAIKKSCQSKHFFIHSLWNFYENQTFFFF